MDVDVVPDLESLTADTVVAVPYFDGDDLADVSDFRRFGGRRLQSVLDSGRARSSLYETTLLFRQDSSPGILLVGAGPRGEATPLDGMRIAATASRLLVARGFTDVAYVHRGALPPFVFGHAFSEGAIRGVYDPGLMKSSRKESTGLSRVTLVVSGTPEAARQGAELGQAVGEASSIARDLVNLPPNELTPSTLADRARNLGQESRLQTEVLDEEAMRGRGMGAILGVSSGSEEEARLIILRYGEPEAPIKLAVVGKGLTFDSGGLSLKTAEGMETMKGDMGGGAAVIAGMTAVARLHPKGISVTGYVGATENMPGGKAMRPGDVLRAMNGESIEVLNTDAEGRLVLADVLSYAVRDGATHILDLATLTGGAVVALGHAATLAAGKPQTWVDQVVRAAGAGFERAWPMPLFPEYRRAMDSDVADIKNVGGRAASALTASAFLSDFVGEVPWAHLDIAGTSFAGEASPYAAGGGTGVGVATIVSLIRELAQK